MKKESNNDLVSESNSFCDSSFKEEYDSTYSQSQTGWSKLWKFAYITYIPITVIIETVLIVMMSQWQVNTTIEKEIVDSIVTGWTITLFYQIVIPFFSFVIRNLVSAFMLPKYKINVLGSFSKSKAIPIMLAMFLCSVCFFALFAWITKDYPLYTSVTNSILHINFYLTGIVTTLSWVAFVLERHNPYKD